MSEKRKPVSVLWVRRGRGKSVKIEFFRGEEFPLEEFEDRQGQPIPTNNLKHFYRLRVGGVWFPRGRKRLYSKNQGFELVKERIFD